ncbi:MAG: type I-E CRISPR-associated protein Cse1/CasA [Ignavibacteriales bacterium]|nr:type I-E CRISPR-associated protein Cse1/CasA [Ignavibacteriales bacterium]MCF8315323.1 type I-E CRISPR-associated protein Cse1/CasA [Ignavibacteriales bacterium]MCF8436785.1 type I-E CRISPR-associated protein Cse1/CasA [Ignavibacteriales bacterium]
MGTFNLIDQKWIPVLRGGPVPERIGLLDCIRDAHKISGIYHDSPLVIMSLFRLLLGILHRVYPLKDVESWNNHYKAGLFSPTSIEEYFEKWKDRFDLFDEVFPFYQIAEHPAGEKTTTVNKLTLHRAAGNNAVYNDHSYNEKKDQMEMADAALYLLVAQTFSPGGGVSATINFQHAPYTSPMLTFLEGNNLFETLLLNMVIESGFSAHDQDQPSWESPNPSRAETATQFTGYLDYLTHQSKMIKLTPVVHDGKTVVEKVCIAQGRGLPENTIDPFAAYRIDEKRGLVPIKIRTEKQLWRDYNTLIRLTDSGSKIRPPLNIIQAAILKEKGVIPSSGNYTILCGGIATDKAKILLWRFDKLPLPLSLLGEQDFVNLCNSAIEYAETDSKKLYSYSTAILKELIKYEGKEADKEEVKNLLASYSVERYYWGGLENAFKEFVFGCAENPENEDLFYENWKITCDRIFSVCKEKIEGSVIGSPRGPKAIAKANYHYEE